MAEKFPVFHHFGTITDFVDFKEKSEIISSLFAKQCSLIDNGIKLPPLFPSFLGLQTNHSWMLTCWWRILKTSANMIQIKTIWSVFACSNYMVNPFVNLIFPSEWKNINVPIHGKTTKCVLKTGDLSLFSDFVAKFSNVLFITRCFHTL